MDQIRVKQDYDFTDDENNLKSNSENESFNQ